MGPFSDSLAGQSGAMKVAKKVPHLAVKNGRFYFRMRVPLALVPAFGSEVSKALGDVTKAQAEVKARELGAEHAARFLHEKHRMGLAASPPVPPAAPAQLRHATGEAAGSIARAASRDMLARDEAIRISGMRSDLGAWWRSELSDLDDVITAALSDGDMRGLWHDFIKPSRRTGSRCQRTATNGGRSCIAGPWSRRRPWRVGHRGHLRASVGFALTNLVSCPTINGHK